MQSFKDARLIALPGAGQPPFEGRDAQRENGTQTMAGRLTLLGAIAPEGAVSVVVVSLPPSVTWDAAALAEGVVRANVRATDTVVALGEGRIGVILQGSDARRTAETVGRVQHRLQRSPLFRGMPVAVAAATGIGRHGTTLLKAATTSLPDCG